MKHSSFFIWPLLAALLFFSACEKDPVIPNEEELITTLTLTLSPMQSGNPVVFTFRDLDGDGGQDPVITTSPLTAGTVYEGHITLSDESQTPAEDITAEVEDEAGDHQFFYIVSGADAALAYLDLDDNGFPVGLNITLNAVSPGAGTLRVVLRHLPDKAAAGVNQGLILNAGGETDIEVTFPLVIQ